jgi:hypothetical protein
MTLTYLLSEKKGTWSDIKKFLEAHLGPVNPNTLHFHLKALIQNGFVIAVGSQEKPVYQIGELPLEIRHSVDNMTKLIKGV